ncbi:FAD/NAD(P)-binding domain-containing protein [Ascobolus immersus RN42]|uniref:FAD/NAD(P)-binding domain-containing protein n=1 Tax=Ascobolus immersus RN42 TaxID=1160509 RepID=A0A3N4IK60_ASCIM|nr:FAD/NAD(P)-binding domain-containing protein [Ascobolus immersus RN42]
MGNNIARFYCPPFPDTASDSTTMPSENIVIIGASWAGLYTAHSILKTLPKDSPNSKLILINPTSTFYWNVASPRLLTSSLLEASDLFIDLVPGFAQYPAQNFEFIQGTATSIVPTSSTVTVRTSEGDKQVAYTQLIIASGAKGISNVPWKNTPDIDLLREISNYKAKIAAANTIVISGGGPTAIETAGELATENPSKKVILIAGEARLLPGLPASAGTEAERQLKALNVEVIKGVRVEGETETGVRTSDGKTVEAEFFLPAHGVLPNNSFIPKEWQSVGGWLECDEYLRVKDHPNVWGVGDIVSYSFRNVGAVNETTAYVSTAIKTILAGGQAATKKFAWGIANKPVALVPIGKSGGTGYFFFMRAWSWLVWYLKGKDFMIAKLPTVVEGQVNTMGKKL